MPKHLSVHSEEAKPFNRAENRLKAAISTRFGVTLIKSGAAHAPVDAVWVRKGECIGCSEHKVRTISREEIRQRGDTYLITEQKLLDGIQVGSLLGAPFYVAALLLPDSKAYVWRITNDHGEVQFQWQAAMTTTQATCEGGEATRLNAYLPFQFATEIPVGSITAATLRLL